SEHIASSSGRWPDGGDEIGRMAIPTPGASNRFFNSESTVTLVDWNANWRYDDLDRDWNTVWKEPSFNDNAWSVGPGLLAMEDDFLTFPVETVLQLNPPTTHYFRHTWSVDSLEAIHELRLEA